MQRVFAGLTAAAFIVVLGAPAFAAVETVKGQVVDQSCYTKDKSNTGLAHKGMPDDCAAMCAKKGMPVALVTAEGKVYVIAGDLAANNNAKLVAHMSHTVEVTGDVMTKDGKMTIASTALKMISR